MGTSSGEVPQSSSYRHICREAPPVAAGAEDRDGRREWDIVELDSSSSPMLDNVDPAPLLPATSVEEVVGILAFDQSSLVLASKNPEDCERMSRCSIYLLSCPPSPALSTISTSPVTAKLGNSFCGLKELLA